MSWASSSICLWAQWILGSNEHSSRCGDNQLQAGVPTHCQEIYINDGTFLPPTLSLFHHSPSSLYLPLTHPFPCSSIDSIDRLITSELPYHRPNAMKIKWAIGLTLLAFGTVFSTIHLYCQLAVYLAQLFLQNVNDKQIQTHKHTLLSMQK